MRRNWASKIRSKLAALIVVALVATVTVAAVNANGLVGSQTLGNDGGAWLVNRARGVVGHVNRASVEVTSRLEVGVVGSLLEVAQADGVIAVHDASLRKLLLVDDRLGITDEGTVLPIGAELIAVDNGLVVWTSNPLAVWVLYGDTLTEATKGNIAEREPDVSGQGFGTVVADIDGHVVVIDPGADTVTLVGPSNATRLLENVGISADAPIDATLLNGLPVLINDGRLGQLVDNGIGWIPLRGLEAGALTLQQPGHSAQSVVVSSPDGVVSRVDTETGEAAELFTSGNGGPLRPIVSGSCTHAGFIAPPSYVRDCISDSDDLEIDLDGYSSELRLHDVNGWIWLNDVSSGLGLVASDRGPTQTVSDWVSAFEDTEPQNVTAGQGDGVVAVTAVSTERANTDASGSDLGSDDEFDGDDINGDPFARDDDARTRVGRPVVVAVLANDEDPDGDVLLVESAESLGAEGTVSVASDGTAVQISPSAEFRGVLETIYTITDGRGGQDTATLRLTVRDADASTNLPPITVDDVVAARPGRPATINLLDNDSDPDGDTLVLTDVIGSGASFAFTVDGLLTVTPDSGIEDQVELKYTVADDFGAKSDGSVVVKVLAAGANSSPDARNDSATVAIGGRVLLNVLGNDSDPDGDALVVPVRPVLVAGDSGGAVSLTISPDGELFFVPTATGTFVWTYAASDGQLSDVAQIRIDVRRVGENRPPVAIRDDVVIPRGGTRIVRVLANDGDPDGDVLGIIDTTVDASSGLTVETIPNVGFRVTVGQDAPSRPQFFYRVSDGLSVPVSAAVVVAVVDGVGADQPPVLQADVVDVRAGGTIQVNLLLNDFDPEGGVLRVIRVGERPEATITINPDGQTVQIAVPTTTRQPFTFVYDAVDQARNQSATTVRVRVLRIDSPNRPPIARPDTVAVRSDASAEIRVLANDSDPDGDPIRVDGIARQPQNGTAVLALESGVIIYTPNPEFRGTDTLEYLLLDALGAAQVGEVRIGVMPAPRQNQAPQAVDDLGFQVLAGSGSIEIPVTANDSDPDNDFLTVVEVAAPQAGSVGLSTRAGSIVYTPPRAGLGFTETRFGYSITDGAGNNASAQVQVLITEPPDDEADPEPPVAVDDVVGPFPAGEEISVRVLDNDSDPDGTIADLRISVGNGASVDGRQVTLVAPDMTRVFRYSITDADDLTDTATITVLVTPNSSPVAETIEVTTAYESPVIVDLGPGAIDPDDDLIEFSCCESVQHGSADVLSAGVGGGRVEFRPDDGFAGTASFAYQVDDREGHQVTGLVQVTVLPLVNTAPRVADVRIELEAGIDQPVDLAHFANDPDPDDALTFSIDPPAEGVVSAVRTGATTIQISAPISAGDDADVRFSYTVEDSFGATTIGSIFIDVVPTSVPPPLAAPDFAATLVGVPVTIPVTQNDSGQGLTIDSISLVEGGTVQIVGSGAVEFIPDSGREGLAATFDYRIADIAGRTSSTTVTVAVTDVPSAPGTPIANDEGSKTCSVSWATPANNGGVISGYLLELDSGATIEVGVTNAVILDNLIDGVTYRFRVTATNEAGTSQASEWSGPCTPDTAPARPSTPAAAFGTSESLVTWNPPAVTQGSVILNYELEIGDAGSGTKTISSPPSGGSVSHLWTGLSNGESYRFRVRAENAFDFGGWSDWSSTVVPCTTTSAPDAPKVTRGDQSFSVVWDPPASNGGCNPTEYEIERDPGATTLSTTTTSLLVSGLNTGEAYRFRVRAQNAAGWSGWSTWSGDLPFCGLAGAPPAPTFQTDRLLSTGYSSESLDLVWGAPGTNGGCPVLSYDVQIAGTGTTQSTGSLPSDAAPFQFTGLANGTAYGFEVRAVNAIGAGPWSAASAQEIPFGPPSCSAGSINATNTGVGQVQVDSTFTCTTNGSPSGLWYRFSNNSGPLADFVPGATVSGLAQSTLYRFDVFVFNSPFVSTGILLGTGEVTTWGPPGQVTGMACSVGDGSGSCVWSAASDNGSAISGYEVELVPGSTTVGHPNTSISYSGLANGTTHTVRARACNAVGCGAWSASASFTPTAPLTVTISRGGSADGVGGCVGPDCSFVSVSLGGPWVAPYNMVCSVNSGADVFFSGVTSAPNNLCFTDRGSEGVAVTLDGTLSNTIFW